MTNEKPALASSRTVVEKTRNPKRVLIVEDNLDSVRSLAMLVGDMGHTVEYAINGYVAVDLVRKFKPQVVLLDLGLPGLDGFEVCRRIKTDPVQKDIRVIAITGYTKDEHRIRTAAAGCEIHLVKPVPPLLIQQLLG
jgi:CheY-like chemotaxis protein